MTPETLYDTWVSGITGIVGRKETTSSQLDEYGKALMLGFYHGAFAQGDHPLPDGTRHFLIVNGMTGPPGDHWHGIYCEPGQPDLVYDSFGRGTRGFHGRGTERDAEQKKTGANRDSCGQRCLAFGLVAQSMGQDAQKI
eukprot:COSAG01_NODE_11943_length_1829_cov_25.165896_1_plen_139_part_00